ncbi:MAG: hypothetical protein GTO18_21340 [Anaerolineales bacterium]|nr:hypothetical protein [Anaerolineales bacterium]
MPDWLDELLYELPSESHPPDLIDRIQLNLENYRRRRRRFHSLLHISLLIAGSIGLGLLVWSWDRLIAMLPSMSTEGIGEWMSRAAQSPPEASMEFISALGIWGRNLAGSLDGVVILAILLLALPAIYGFFINLERPKATEGVIG